MAAPQDEHGSFLFANPRSFRPIELAGRGHRRKSNRRSNLRLWVLAKRGNACSHKNTDRHHRA